MPYLAAGSARDKLGIIALCHSFGVTPRSKLSGGTWRMSSLQMHACSFKQQPPTDPEIPYFCVLLGSDDVVGYSY